MNQQHNQTIEVEVGNYNLLSSNQITSRWLYFNHWLHWHEHLQKLIIQPNHSIFVIFTADQTLQGFLPVVAKWHAKLCLVTASITTFYVFSISLILFRLSLIACIANPSNEWCTIFQLKQLIDHTSIKGGAKHGIKG